MASVAPGAGRPVRARAQARRRSVVVVAAAATALAAVVAVCTPRPAAAQSAEAQATRRELAAQADEARTSGDHARALELAQRAAAIAMSPSLRLFIAQEQSALGRVAEAYVNADQCAREADADAGLRNRAVVLRTCSALAAELRDRVARVVVRVPDPPAGVRVTISGEPVERPLWGIPYVVNPGTVTVEARAPGFRAFAQSVTLAAGASRDVVVALDPALEAAPGGGTSSSGDTGASAPGDATSAPRDTGAPRGAAGGPGVAPWVVVGVGGAAVVTAGVLFALRAVALGECHDGTCPSQDTIDRVYGFTTAALITGSVGLAAIAGGVIWAVLAAPRRPAPAATAATSDARATRSASPRARAVTVRPTALVLTPSVAVAGGGAAVQLEGRF